MGYNQTEIPPLPTFYQGRLECAYARGNKREALDIVVQMFEAKDRPPEPITLDSHVAEAFDVRLAITLEDSGVCYLRDLKGVTEGQLLANWGMGRKQIEEIRERLRQVCTTSRTMALSFDSAPTVAPRSQSLWVI